MLNADQVIELNEKLRPLLRPLTEERLGLSVRIEHETEEARRRTPNEKLVELPDEDRRRLRFFQHVETERQKTINLLVALADHAIHAACELSTSPRVNDGNYNANYVICNAPDAVKALSQLKALAEASMLAGYEPRP